MNDVKRERELAGKFVGKLADERKAKLEREAVWNELKMVRVEMIARGLEPTPLSGLLLGDFDRESQQRREGLVRENYAHDQRCIAQGLMQGVAS